MPVSFDKLVVGESYERPFLASLWGYQAYQAISKGVVTPANTKFIILFVTEKKQDSLTQYNDYIEGSSLHWEGEEKHGNDNRIVNAFKSNDEIHLFHRERHHSPFVYKGIILLQQHNLLSDAPSQFIFSLPDRDKVSEPTSELKLFQESYIRGGIDTERFAIAKSRIGQGVFRDGLLRLWGGCAVTGYDRKSILLASHIKPWKDSSNKERLDPYNGLLLQPTIDRLFDRGLISFDNTGRLVKSDNIAKSELVALGVDPKARLRNLLEPTMDYLVHHRNHELGKSKSSDIILDILKTI